MGSKSKQAPRGIVLDQKIKNFGGHAVRDLGMPDGQDAEGKPKYKALLLRNVLTDSLLRDDVAMDARGRVVLMPIEGTVKHKRFLLAQAIHNAGERHEFTSAETSMLKEQVSKHHPTMVAGMVCIILDPAEANKA